MKTKTNSKLATNAQIDCHEITDYLDQVESGAVRSCERQKLFCRYVRRTFAEETLFVDKERLAKYAGYLKYFPYDQLYPWEWCLFALFCCTFKENGRPRWTDLIDFMGRGGGKTGFIAFVSLCLITNTNGIKEYDIDICANSEEQARMAFDELHDNVLEAGDQKKLRKGFKWNMTVIRSKTTNSKIKYRTNSPKSKDGMRSGMVIFDEVHQYTHWKNITVFTTGLGKKPHPRRAFISSNGDVREGVFDSLLERCDGILKKGKPDKGYLPFVCSLDEASEVHDSRNWEKANPSLPYLPDLKEEIEKEYEDWLDNPYDNPDFMTKRMGIPQGDEDADVTSHANLMRASREIPDLRDYPCVCGIDLARKDDFISACLLFKVDDDYYVKHHSWLCKNSRDWTRIDERIRTYDNPEALTIVDDVDIPASVVSDWIYEQQGIYDIVKVAADDYRFDILRDELEGVGYTLRDKTAAKIRPSDHMRVLPVIDSAFKRDQIAWGDDRLMRWFTSNTKVVTLANSNGNFKYDKIEPRSRKTDGFMALVAAFCIAEAIPYCTFKDDYADDFVW